MNSIVFTNYQKAKLPCGPRRGLGASKYLDSRKQTHFMQQIPGIFSGVVRQDPDRRCGNAETNPPRTSRAIVLSAARRTLEWCDIQDAKFAKTNPLNRGKSSIYSAGYFESKRRTHLQATTSCSKDFPRNVDRETASFSGNPFWFVTMCVVAGSACAQPVVQKVGSHIDDQGCLVFDATARIEQPIEDLFNVMARPEAIYSAHNLGTQSGGGLECLPAALRAQYVLSPADNSTTALSYTSTECFADEDRTKVAQRKSQWTESEKGSMKTWLAAAVTESEWLRTQPWPEASAASTPFASTAIASGPTATATPLALP